jgi:hypothetical protein
MSEGPRFFTVEEANALVPTLQFEFGLVAATRSELVRVVTALGGPEVAVGVLQDEAAAPSGLEGEAVRLRELAGEVSAAVERVNELGCLVKDVEQGLVDFYAEQDGETVFLCWQYGEPAVTHWHAVEAGFAGRQPIEGAEPPTPAFVN